MRMGYEDKIRTLKLHLSGLYANEKEIEDFLSKYPLISFDCLKFYWACKFYYQLRRNKNKQIFPVLKKIKKIRDFFKRWKGIFSENYDTKYLLRVDDFPHWKEKTDNFKKFLEIMEKYETPFLLGVVPLLSLDHHNPLNKKFHQLKSEEISILSHPLIEIALHGFTHQTLRLKFHSEFIGLSEIETEKCIKKGIEKLSLYGLKPVAFIPPFNTINIENYKAIKKYFNIICGGSEGIKYFGFKISPVYISGSLYIPSYRPLCSSAKMIADFIERFKPEGILPITLHWHGEIGDDFAGVKRLANLIKGKTIRWENI